jgi:hypothetical protein
LRRRWDLELAGDNAEVDGLPERIVELSAAVNTCMIAEMENEA